MVPENFGVWDREMIIVVSTASGFGTGERTWEGILKDLFGFFGLNEERRWDSDNQDWIASKESGGRPGYSLVLTRSAHDIGNLVNKLAPKPGTETQLIVMLSGDTVITELLNTLPPPPATTQRLFSLIPTGTGNALASTLYRRGAFSPMSTLVLGTPHVHPTFHVRFSTGESLRGAVVVSWGFHASLVADSDGKDYREKYGNERFAVAAHENLTPSPHIYKGGVLKLDGTETELGGSEHFYTLLSLVSNLEKKLTISPQTAAPRPLDTDNGEDSEKEDESSAAPMHLLQIRPGLSPDRIMAIMGAAYNGGKHVDDEDVVYTAVSGVRIEFEEEDYMRSEGDPEMWGPGRWRRVCVDGKIIEGEKGGWVEVGLEAGEGTGLPVLWRG